MVVNPPSCQGDQEAVAQVLSRHPYYLSYRLERIVTRGEYLRSLDRLPAESPTGWLSCTGEREPNYVGVQGAPGVGVGSGTSWLGTRRHGTRH